MNYNLTEAESSLLASYSTRLKDIYIINQEAIEDLVVNNHPASPGYDTLALLASEIIRDRDKPVEAKRDLRSIHKVEDEEDYKEIARLWNLLDTDTDTERLVFAQQYPSIWVQLESDQAYPEIRNNFDEDLLEAMLSIHELNFFDNYFGNKEGAFVVFDMLGINYEEV